MPTYILAACLLLAAVPQTSAPLSPRAGFVKDRVGKPIPFAIVLEFVDEDALRAAGGSKERAAAEVVKSMVAETIDLDGDGRTDWVVRQDCSAVGNCNVYVYRATPKGFKQVLDVGDMQTVSTRPRSSKGLRDLEVRSHGSAFDGEMFVYRFDGRVYRRVACMTYTYRVLDARGDERLLKRPKLTPEKCEDEEQ